MRIGEGMKKAFETMWLLMAAFRACQATGVRVDEQSYSLIMIETCFNIIYFNGTLDIELEVLRTQKRNPRPLCAYQKEL